MGRHKAFCNQAKRRGIYPRSEHTKECKVLYATIVACGGSRGTEWYVLVDSDTTEKARHMNRVERWFFRHKANKELREWAKTCGFKKRKKEGI